MISQSMLKEDKRNDELITVPLTGPKGLGRICYVLTVRQNGEGDAGRSCEQTQTGGTAVRGASSIIHIHNKAELYCPLLNACWK